MTNSDIARRLMTHAREVETEGGSVYRVRSYRTAAQSVERMNTPIEDILRDRGRAGLETLPGIGKNLAYSIEALVRDGELKTLSPVDASREPARLFASLPGVGTKLAGELRDTLGLKTLEELKAAADAGKLASVGVGAKRLAGILAALDKRMGVAIAPVNEPSLADLLAVDAEYRSGMKEDSVPRLAPRWFEPEGEAWLGIHQTDRDGWKLKALFSNTALAHRLGRQRDWVVVYFQKGELSGQRTVVTETRGEMAGRRVVRGREAECRVLYGVRPVTSEPAA